MAKLVQMKDNQGNIYPVTKIIQQDVETFSGEIINNAPVFVKRFNVGNLPNNGIITPILNIADNIVVLKIEGTAYKDNFNDTVNIMSVTTLCLFRLSTKQLFIDTNTDRSSFSAWVNIYYRKK